MDLVSPRRRFFLLIFSLVPGRAPGNTRIDIWNRLAATEEAFYNSLVPVCEGVKRVRNDPVLDLNLRRATDTAEKRLKALTSAFKAFKEIV